MMSGRLLIWLVVVLSMQNAHGQYYANQNMQWAFGVNAGLDFTSGSPVPFNTAMFALEGSASVSDRSGNLLFYTEGKQVYNRAHALMPSGASVVPFQTISTAQAAVVVPVIGHSSQYYLFSLENITGTATPHAGHLCYSVIDMNLAGGMGDVVSTARGIVLDSNLGESLIAVPGGNCNVWIIVHKLDDPQFRAFEVTAAGVSRYAIISNVGYLSGPYAWSQAILKCTPDRRKIVAAKNKIFMVGWPVVQDVELYDFDPSSGYLSNAQVIDSFEGAYGAEFSPDNSKLYTSQVSGIGVLQYDVTLPTTAAIIASKVMVGTGPTTLVSDMRLGPDGRIYLNSITPPYTTDLDRIDAPNMAGVACNYTPHAVSLGGNTTRLGFPSLVWVVDSTADIAGPNTVCVGATTSYTDATPAGTWHSGNQGIATIDSNTGVLTGVATGVVAIYYTFTTGNCPAAKVVTVIATSPGTITGPTSVCVGKTITMADGVPGGVWGTAIGRATATGAVITGVSAGVDTVRYTVTGVCGPATATKPVTVHALPAVGTIGGPGAVCPGGVISLTETVPGGIWSSSNLSVATIGSTGQLTGVNSGVVNISYRVTNSFCTNVAVRSISVNPFPHAGTIMSDGVNAFCLGYTMHVWDTTQGGVWSTTNSHAVLAGSTLTAVSTGADTVLYIVTNSCGSDTARYGVYVPAPLPLLTGNLKICVGDTTILSDSVWGGMWSGGSGKAIVYASLQDSGIVIGVTAGVATITYHMDLGCSTTIDVTVNPAPDAGVIAGRNTICRGVTTLLSDGAPAGVWSSTNNGVATVNSAGSTAAVDTGTTMIIYTAPPNVFGCIASDTFVLRVILPDFSLTKEISNVTCYSGNDGGVALLPHGTAGPFTYLWANGVTTSSMVNLRAGTYGVVVTDSATLCAVTDSIGITQPDSLAVSSETTKDLCRMHTGSIELTVAGGTTPYRYMWSNNRTVNIIADLLAGPYTVVITDAMGCAKEGTFVIEDSVCTEVIVHDGVSPNRDGVNDTWVIDGIGEHVHNTVRVFDKFGDLVFEKQHYQNDWSGTGRNGAPLPDGTYFYLVQLNDEYYTGVSVFKGAVMVKR